ncbi:MAG: beta-lactamase family protein [Pseudomonadota bacterium]|nr:beta-lactamase family protein [Pseudomonadota bacterium]
MARLVKLVTAIITGMWCLQCLALPQDTLDRVFKERTEAALGTLVREGRSSFAAAVLVRDGRTVAASAYGVEDPASRVPVSIDSTLIDLNSLRKLFIAVSLAQLIDRHVIASIDDPVNRYLKHYHLPKAYGREVTIREVATHTAGFDQTDFGAGRLRSDPPRFFAERFPGYVKNAGSFSVYDGYGPALLSYLVSEATGRPFTGYVEDAILRALGMDDTHLRAMDKPLTHRIVAFQPRNPAKLSVGAPLMPLDAAQIDAQSVSTIADMAKFMIALLGPAADQQVITPAMRELLFTIHQANGTGGSAHGLLFDAIRAGNRTLFVHGGVGSGSQCMMGLDAAKGTGIFYCYGAVRMRFDKDPSLFPPPFEQMTDAMLRLLTDCHEETSGCPQFPHAGWNDAWRPYLGVYVSAARHHRGFSRLRSIIHPTLARIERSGDALALDGVGGFLEISPGVFGKPQQLETFTFIRNESTGKTLLSVSDRPSVYDRIDSPAEDPRVLAGCLAALAGVALSGAALLLFPAYGAHPRIRIAAGSYAAVVACGVAALFGLSAFGHRYFEGYSWPLDIVRVCAFLTIPVCLLMFVNGMRVRDSRSTLMGRLRRLHYDVIAVSSVVLVLMLLGIELISFSRIT